MRKSSLVLAAALCSALALSICGCSGSVAETTTTIAATTTTTLPPTTTTVEITTTTTTTTELPGAWSVLPAGETAPAPRLGSTLAYAPATSLLYVYGGWDGTVFYDGIWSYDPAAAVWNDLDPRGAAPPARALHSMALLPASGRLIVFGGYDGSNYLADTWAYDIAENEWTNLVPAGELPAARDGHSLVFDPVRDQVILFGGWDGANEFGDTWVYDPAANTWTELDPAGDRPAARDSQAMTYDSAGDRVILFGGWNQSTEFRDTWLFDPAAGTWANAAPAGDWPPARALAQMIYDPKAERVILFGGGTVGNVVTADTWIYNPSANTWNPVAPTGTQPDARTGHAMAYDSTEGSTFLFGGSSGSTFFNDVWMYQR